MIKRKVKMLLITLLMFFLTLTSIIYIQAFRYPKEWNSKIVGQKRSEIHHLLGAPTYGDNWDVKADLWITENFYSSHRLDVMYNTDTISQGYIIAFYFGNKIDYIRVNLDNSFK